MKKDKNTFLIVDGHNLLFQMFYGMPQRIVNRDGRPIQGVVGFVGALIKILKQTNPQYTLVLFDGEHKNSRTEILPEYKANRIDYVAVLEEENPFLQLPDIYRALTFMGIKFCETDDAETDDVIAGYSYQYGKEMQIMISSWDSDFFQLVSDNVSVIRYRGKNTYFCDTAYVENRFMVKPALYSDFKALVGDKSDNIKGAEKIGPKTAGMLLRKFGSLHGIIDNADSIDKKSIRESITGNKERLLINYQLIKLNDSAQLPFRIDELSYSYNGLKTKDVLCKAGIE